LTFDESSLSLGTYPPNGYGGLNWVGFKVENSAASRYAVSGQEIVSGTQAAYVSDSAYFYLKSNTSSFSLYSGYFSAYATDGLILTANVFSNDAVNAVIATATFTLKYNQANIYTFPSVFSRINIVQFDTSDGTPFVMDNLLVALNH